ncbi:MAG TPA: MFS transporter, partial [Acidimicrobiales bacterium]
MFIGQQFLQNVHEYSSVEAGAAILPAAVFMVLVAPTSARLVEQRGSRFTLLVGSGALLLGFVVMLVLWDENSPYWHVGLAYALVGIGVGTAGTPASRSLTASTPVTRAGMASGTADLQRDLGGAVMQSILGALLAAGYTSAMAGLVAGASSNPQLTDGVQSQLTKSFGSAANLAEQQPQYSSQIIQAARESFLDGSHWAYFAGIVAVIVGMVVTWICFPRHDEEHSLLDEYASEDGTPQEEALAA